MKKKSARKSQHCGSCRGPGDYREPECPRPHKWRIASDPSPVIRENRGLERSGRFWGGLANETEPLSKFAARFDEAGTFATLGEMLRPGEFGIHA